MMKRKVIFLQPHHELYFLRVKDGLPHVLYILPDKIELNNSPWNMKNFASTYLGTSTYLPGSDVIKKNRPFFFGSSICCKILFEYILSNPKILNYRNFEPSHLFSLSPLYKLAGHDGPKLRHDWRHRWFGIRVHFFHTRPNS